MSDLRDEYLAAHGGYGDIAAIAFARDLMEDDPKNFKRGYTRENAILAAQEMFPGAIAVYWEKEIPND